MMHLKPLILLILLTFKTLHGHAQLFNKNSPLLKGNFGLGFNDLPGFIWAHNSDNRNTFAPANSFELQLIKKTEGNTPWEIKYKLPRISLALMYSDFGKPELTGKGFSLIPQFEFGIIRKKNAELNFKLGTGLAYITKIYDAQDNYKNTSIGAPVNLAFQGFFMYHQKLWKNLELNAGIGLMHFSCGNIRLPNLGINYPTLSLGVSYFQKNQYKREVPAFDSTQLQVKKQWGYLVFGGWAYKEQGLRRYRRFDVISLSNNLQYRMSMRSTWLAGIDVFFDKSYFYLAQSERENFTSSRFSDNVQAALTAGHILKAGRISMITQFGGYVYYPYRVKKPVYQRLGLKADLYKNISAGVFLKTHFLQADFVEWVIGYSLFSKSQ